MVEEDDDAIAAWVQQRMLTTGIRVRIFDQLDALLAEGDITNGGDVLLECVPTGTSVSTVEVIVGDILVYRGDLGMLPVVGNGGDVILKGAAIARDARATIEAKHRADDAQRMQSLQALHASGVVSAKTVVEQLDLPVELEGEG